MHIHLTYHIRIKALFDQSTCLFTIKSSFIDGCECLLWLACFNFVLFFIISALPPALFNHVAHKSRHVLVFWARIFSCCVMGVGVNRPSCHIVSALGVIYKPTYPTMHHDQLGAIRGMWKLEKKPRCNKSLQYRHTGGTVKSNLY